MKENFELYEHIFNDAEMACFTIEELLKDIKNKDNKIKRCAEDILKEYTSYKDEARSKLEMNNQEINETSSMSKMMAGMGIKKEVISDNSDSSMADLLIQGISIGSINTEKKIKDYDKDLDNEQLKFAKDFLKFQEKAIDELKEYL